MAIVVAMAVVANFDDYDSETIFFADAVQKLTVVPVPNSFAFCPSCSLENCVDCCNAKQKNANWVYVYYS